MNPIRPQRVEPRVKKRRPKSFAFMIKPRQALRQQMLQQERRGELNAIRPLRNLGDLHFCSAACMLRGSWTRARVPGRLAPGAVTGAGLKMREPAWESARQQLIRRLRAPAVPYGPATVARSTVTDVFVDASRVTLLSRGRSVIAALLVPLLAHDHVDALGGPARRHPSWHGG